MHQISPEGIAFVKEKEGFRSDAYYDVAGVLTIGYGHSIYAPSIEEYPIHEGQHITEEEGEEILRADLKPTEAAVNSAVTRDITQKQYHDGFFRKGSKASESVETLTGYSAE